MQLEIPHDWRLRLATLAYLFGWGPRELMRLKLRDIDMWMQHVYDLQRQSAGTGGRQSG